MQEYMSRLTSEDNPARRQHLRVSRDEGIAYHDTLWWSFSRDNGGCYGVKTHSLIDGAVQVWQDGDGVEVEGIYHSELGMDFLSVFGVLGEEVGQECKAWSCCVTIVASY